MAYEEEQSISLQNFPKVNSNVEGDKRRYIMKRKHQHLVEEQKRLEK